MVMYAAISNVDGQVHDLQRRAFGFRRVMSAVGAALVALAGWSAYAAPAEETDPLATAFRDPPMNARPRVWWHWMNGNITQDGLLKDLEWMNRVGIGGVQVFDAALDTPQIVDRRIVYMSPEWKAAFRSVVRRADALGMEFGIATSAGWSETGGPWVSPEDGMKKLVWSETLVSGGRRFQDALALPPALAGPYQDVPGKEGGPAFYRDALVIAYALTEESDPARPQAALSNQAPIDVSPLLDSAVATGVPIPASESGIPGAIVYRYARPQTIRSATVFITDLAAGSALSAPIAPTLEASDDGRTWRKIVKIEQKDIPATVSFAPVTARWFRLTMTRGKGPDYSNLQFAAGADLTAAANLASAGGPDGPKAPTVAEFRLGTAARINAFEQKAGFIIPDDYSVLDHDTGPDVKGVPTRLVMDITSRMSADGRLDWTPPAGRWRVLRMGYSLTGKTNHPATREATGLEVDKYDAAAVARYLDTYLAMYRDVTSADMMGRRGLSALVSDSAEFGPANWTPKLIEQFKRLRGYDPRPWLPTLTGTIIGSRRESDAFLSDFRRTLGELLATEHYGTVARIAHRNDMVVYGESLEGYRGALGDDLEMRRFADIPMAAIWTFRQKPFLGYVGDVRGAASNAHVYGRTYVAAESLTSVLSPWAFAPSDLQPMIDAAFALGVNRPVIHSSVHQPVDDKVPGLSLAVFGQYFNRHDTWAEMARPWIDYIARTGLLLQQGRNVADVAYFYGEDAPAGELTRRGVINDTPTRYAFDYISRDALLNQLSVADGDLVTPAGARYRLLYLGGESGTMTVAALRKLADLVGAGATVVGMAPTATFGLADDRAEFDTLVRRLWGTGSGGSVGKGRVIASNDVEAALASIGVAPDFSDGVAAEDATMFAHRRTEEGDIYFVSSRIDAPSRIEASFRVTGKAPEFWYADTGAIKSASYRIEGDRTIVPLDFQPKESVFVFFRKPATEPTRTIAQPAPVAVSDLNGPWQVMFQPGRGAPERTTLNRLAPLSEHDDPGIKYFSGTATYTTSFTLPRTARSQGGLELDLGRIGDVAEVRVNGQLAGTVWKAPYRLKVGGLVRPGQNRLEIRVANLWVNRLIGDAQPGATKVAFTTVKTYTARAPLRPSGLIGPVRLMTTRGEER